MSQSNMKYSKRTKPKKYKGDKRMSKLTKEKFEQGFKHNETCKAFDLKGARAINFFQQFFFF